MVPLCSFCVRWSRRQAMQLWWHNEMFRFHLEQSPGIKEWQIRQAIDAAFIYKYQFTYSAVAVGH